METAQLKDSLDKEIRRFAGRLRKSYTAEIEGDPSFRARVIGRLRGLLPRKRPGRKPSPQVGRAAEIYKKDYLLQGKPANWHAICRNVYADYGGLSAELQRLRRYQLRAAVHSLRYESRSREKRKAN
jgi:hypothetical protein